MLLFGKFCLCMLTLSYFAICSEHLAQVIKNLQLLFNYLGGRFWFGFVAVLTVLSFFLHNSRLIIS